MGKKDFVKHSKEARLHFSKEDLRWATNELAADWRAQRLKCDKITDVGCGIGFQAMSFAKKFGRVFAVDIDKDKVAEARKNAKKLNFSNIDFVAGDALSDDVFEKAKGSQIIFLDPQRDEAADVREIGSIKPNISAFLEKYSQITQDIAIEFPPQIRQFPEGCEREYLSIDGKLNRLTLYFGKLKKAEVSAVVLPQKVVLQKKEGYELKKAEELKSYLYEADHAVQKAGLLPELTQSTGAELFEEKKYAFLTSEEKIKSPFFKSSYLILGQCSFDKKLIVQKLKEVGAGKILIRYEIDPQAYWAERKGFEDNLAGDLQVVLFRLKDTAVICEQLA